MLPFFRKKAMSSIGGLGHSLMHCMAERPTKNKILTRVVTPCNAGLHLALLFLFLFLGHYSEYCIIVQFHPAFSILHMACTLT
jgi:hypothetical protein